MRAVPKLIVANLTARPTRAVLTALAVAAAVMLMVAVTSGYKTVESAALGFFQEQLGSADLRIMPDRGTPLTVDDAAAIEARPDVRTAVPRLVRRLPITLNDQTVGVNVQGVTDGDDTKARLPVTVSTLIDIEPGDDSQRLKFDSATARQIYLDPGAFTRLDASPGDVLELPTADGPVPFEVVGYVDKPRIIAGAMTTAYVPLAALQALDAEGGGAVSTVFIEVEPGVQPAALADELEPLAAANGWEVDLTRETREEIDNMMLGMRLLALMGGSVTLLAGSFIVFTTLSMGVAERQRMLAMLRAIGAGRWQVAASVLGEGLIIVALGVAIGLPLGLASVQFLSVIFSDVLGDDIQISGLGMVVATVGMGVAAIVAGLLPAWRAVRTDPLSAMSPQAGGNGSKVPWLLVGVGVLLAAFDTALLFSPDDTPLPTMFGLFPDDERAVRFYGHIFVGVPALMIGFFLLAPAAVWAVEKVALFGLSLGRKAKVGVPIGLAVLAASVFGGLWLVGVAGAKDVPAATLLPAVGGLLLLPVVMVAGLALLAGWLFTNDAALLRQQLTGGLWRAAGTAAALMVGLSTLVIMQVQGNTAIGGWQLPDGFPDVFIYTDLGDFRGLSPSDQQAIANAPQIAARPDGSPDVMPVYLFHPRLGDSPWALAATRMPNSTTCLAAEPEQLLDMLNLTFVRGNREEALALLRGGQAIIITEEFRRLRGYDVGDPFPLSTPKGELDFTVAAVVNSPGLDVMIGQFDLAEQFESEAASTVFATAEDAENIFGVTDARIVAANLRSDVPSFDKIDGKRAERDAMVAQLQAELGRTGLNIADVRTLKEDIQTTFRRILQMASFVAWAAMGVASFGVTNAVIASVRSRQWQFGLLRALGVTRTGLMKIVLAEAALLGAVGTLLGLAAGMLLALNARRVTAQLIGFQHPLDVPWGVVGLGAAAVVLVSLLAAAEPALRAARATPLSLLQAGRSAA
jgi:ABC-type antimicrobial peptide transport system permease subunit